MGTNNELAESKLVLLYLLEKLNMKLNNLQLVKIVLENNFMNYFFLQQFLNELAAKEMIKRVSSEGKAYYMITQTGRETLGYFIKMIPLTIRSNIDSSIAKIKKNLKNETLIKADYIPESEREFIVVLSIHEDSFPLVELKLTVGTKNDAIRICDNWEKNSQLIYSEIIDSLMKSRN